LRRAISRHRCVPSPPSRCPRAVRGSRGW
jgi:hypothetical protein